MHRILPLDGKNKIYALCDEQGNTIGTGTREVCEVLLYIITRPLAEVGSGRPRTMAPLHRGNVRSAITI